MYVKKKDKEINNFVKEHLIDTDGFYVLIFENFDNILNPIKKINLDEGVISTIDKEIVEIKYEINKVKSNDVQLNALLYQYYYTYKYIIDINQLLVFEDGNKFFSKNKEYLKKYVNQKIENYGFVIDKLKDDLYNSKKNTFSNTELKNILKTKRLDLERIKKEL